MAISPALTLKATRPTSRFHLQSHGLAKAYTKFQQKSGNA